VIDHEQASRAADMIWDLEKLAQVTDLHEALSGRKD